MGCVPTKGFTRDPQNGNWYSRLSRNVSGASRNRRLRFGKEGGNAVALASSSYGELNSEAYQGSFLSLGRGNHFNLRTEFEFENLLVFTSSSDTQCKMASADAKPRMRGEERKSFLLQDSSEAESAPVFNSLATRNGAEMINTWELMEGLEDGGKIPSSWRPRDSGGLDIPKQKGFVDDSVGDAAGSPVWKKYYMQEDAVVSMDFSFARNMQTPPMGSPFSESPRRAHTPPPGSPFNGSPRWVQTPFMDSPFSEAPSRVHTPPMGSPFNRSPKRGRTPCSGSPSPSPFSQSARKSPSRGSFMDIEDCRSVSSIELLDASTIGLKFFVSPANSSFHPSPTALKEGSHSARLSFDGNSTHACPYSDNAKGPYRSRNSTRHNSKKPSTESVYGCGSPLFDPSLMATFEQALKATTEAPVYGEWFHFSTEESTPTSLSTVDTKTSFDTFSDAESTPLWCSKENMLPTITQTHEERMRRKKHLSSYDLRCPPRGEGKVVLYITSMRGIRKTYEDCCNLRLILRGLGVQMDERDVWMHAMFRGELADILGGLPKAAQQVPQLFIKGRHIGGAEEVKHLHEEGVLACLMEGLAMGLIHDVCAGCGDARFVPCFSCNGSCKVLIAEDEVLRCRDCNENGLIMCPMCNT